MRKPELIAGKYELLDVGGRGGMSTVWRAYQHGPGRFRRVVAVKQLFAHLAEQQLYRDMFLEEARIGAILDDPNVAQIFDFLLHDGDYFLVMEWIEGIDLRTYVDYVFTHLGRKTDWRLMVGVVIGMLRGLAAAHERKDSDGQAQPVVHRDITPHNVLIGVKGTARLIDFGLALASDRDGESTDPGIAKGKIAYLAPEVVRGTRPSPLSDQYAAGALLWEALAGRRLFAQESQYETLKAVAEGSVEPLDKVRPDVPKALRTAVHRALAFEPADRFDSVREMANCLSGIFSASPAQDTYARLSKTVRDARAALGLDRGLRPPGFAEETPVPVEEESGIIELDPAELQPAEETDPGGLLQRLLSKFGK